MKDTNFFKMRNIVLNDRWGLCYKPDKACVEKLGILLPDASIFGFGFMPRLGFWILMVECPRFPDNPYGVIRDMLMSEISAYAKLEPPPPPKPKPVTWFWQS